MDERPIPWMSFAHPMDHGALEALRSYVESKAALRDRLRAVEASTLSDHREMNLAYNTRIGPSQFGRPHEIVATMSQRLGLETPEVYVDTQPDINAMAIGGPHGGSITFNTALLEAFDDDEVAVVAGHELGHIVAEHSFYRLVASRFDVVQNLLAAVPGGSLLGLVLQWLVGDWYGKAERTADRAALIATGDVSAVQRVILKLAGGSTVAGMGRRRRRRVLGAGARVPDILEERAADASFRDKIEMVVSDLLGGGAARTHPLPALRYLEITEWAEGEQFTLLRQGDFAAASEFAAAHSATPRPTTDTMSLARQVGRGMLGSARDWRKRQS